jgi:hypothetical protein
MCDFEGQAAIERRTSLGQLFQFYRAGETPTIDCGYFCGVALKLLYDSPGNPGAVQVNRRQVYEQREGFLRETRNLTSPRYTHRHEPTYSLDPHDAPLWLRFLGFPFTFNCVDTLGAFRPDTADFCRRMAAFMGNRAASILGVRRFGVMFCQWLGMAGGHWVALLGNAGPDGAQAFLVYDSSGVCGIDTALRWTPRNEMDFYARSHIRAVVSLTRPH